MIALLALVVVALILAAGTIFGPPALIALSGVLVVLVLIGVASDAWRVIEARRTAYRRWREWQRRG